VGTEVVRVRLPLGRVCLATLGVADEHQYVVRPSDSAGPDLFSPRGNPLLSQTALVKSRELSPLPDSSPACCRKRVEVWVKIRILCGTVETPHVLAGGGRPSLLCDRNPNGGLGESADD